MSEASRPLPAAQPPLARGAMTARPWAGHPLVRGLKRLVGRGAHYTYPAPSDRPWLWRRFWLLVLVAAGAVLGTSFMADVLPHHGGTWIEQGVLVLFGVLFAWISAGFWTGLMGAWVLLRRRDPESITNVLDLRDADEAPIEEGARTAIIMPICNEDVAAVCGNLRATYESLRETGLLKHFDFYMLSDTNKADLRAAEQVAFTELRETLGLTDGQVGGGFFYRWRQHRTKRKAGNVADFCRRWGGAYRYMVVLDADSVMTGECLTKLVRMMEARPDAGIIQTAPRACGMSTFHARAQQFGSRVYGPLFTAGMHYWQLGESHYWGHNAILRVAPFMKHCALAALPGSGSMSGEIMSHDFVEAALMRRAGWKVWIAHDLEGSYEQVPPNLLSEVQRDSRWCHGNMQNSRLMFEPGLHPVHRSVFLTGVLAYVSAPLWLGFLLLSTLLFTGQANEVPQYFVAPYQLFPVWPTSNVELMLTLFGLTALLLLAPKALSLSVIVLRGEAKEYGGVFKLLTSAVIEFLYTMLLAPVRMLFHTQFVIAALMGWSAGWKSPPRDDGATPWSEALRRHGLHTLLALGWIVAILMTSSAFPWWLSPVLLGLLLAAPLSAWASRLSVGRALRRAGLLLTPEEQHEPPVLTAARQYGQAVEAEASFDQIVEDVAVRGRAALAFNPRPVATGAKAAARTALVTRALEGELTPQQQLRLVGSAEAMGRLADLMAVPQPSWTPEPAVLRRPQPRRVPPRGVRVPQALSGLGASLS